MFVVCGEALFDVFAAGDKYELLAKNVLDEMSLATPAVAVSASTAQTDSAGSPQVISCGTIGRSGHCSSVSPYLASRGYSTDARCSRLPGAKTWNLA